MNVFDYIKNYCDERNITKYSCKSKVITLDEMNKNFTFSPGIAFFYHFAATGEINNIKSFGNNFFSVSTPSDFYDFAKMCSFEDSGALQKAVSDFIFVVDNTMTLKIESGVTALFQDIKSAQLFYMYVLPQKNNDERTININIKE